MLRSKSGGIGRDFDVATQVPHVSDRVPELISLLAKRREPGTMMECSKGNYFCSRNLKHGQQTINAPVKAILPFRGGDPEAHLRL